jgi:hypothetical protein
VSSANGLGERLEFVKERGAKERYRPAKTFVVCNEPAERVRGPVRILPWNRFLEELWSDRIVS